MAAPPSAIAVSAAKPMPADTAVQITGAETASRPTVPATAAIRTTGTCLEVTVARPRCAFQSKCMSFLLVSLLSGESAHALAGWHPSLRRCELRGNTHNSLLDSLRLVIVTLSQDLGPFGTTSIRFGATSVAISGATSCASTTG